jgi:transposase-like protein
MAECNVEVDHSTSYHWMRKSTPQLETGFRKAEKARSAGACEWMELVSRPIASDNIYRAVDAHDQAI